MPRRGAKAPSSDSALTGGSVTVISGTIRTPDDADALSVKLSIWDTEITMRADGVELGNWAASEISIRAIDSTSFEFVAEGDQLIFTPEDSTAFAATSFVKGRVPGGGRKSRRRGNKKAEQARAAVVVPDPHLEAETRRGKRQSAEKPRPPKPSRRERKAAERESAESAVAEARSNVVVAPSTPREATVRQEAVPTPIGRIKSGATADHDSSAEEKRGIRIPAFNDPVPEPTALFEPEPVQPSRVEPEPVQEPAVRAEPAPAGLPPRVEPEPAALLESEFGDPPQRAGAYPAELLEPEPERAARRRKSLLRRSTREDLPAEGPSVASSPEAPVGDEPEEEGPAQPNRLWIRTLDLARRYDFLGLDRVPVNESLRGQDHQHTWDHRVAPTSGPGRYICTLCGEIRR